ncbi:peptidoglycan-binding protein [Methylobacterium sp. J-090]|uniref:peptidoglycan-binding protein n=1 Tax=Methylobacterium sp. J-090 TaxID=2836666 RepID=UPI001FB8B9C8|nr:peptidoglycan-binding protein [Methylobacterium sp. J-090]MCJ2080770.1 peptidoglycan-binding protein [Methylobacterium sp. J-090]
MSFWVSTGLSFVVKLITEYLANRRAEEALRDLGAATQANASRVEAERQEAIARRAGEAAAEEPDDPRDLRRDP